MNVCTLGVQVDHYFEVGINNSRVDYLAALMVGLTYTVYLYNIYIHFKKGKKNLDFVKKLPKKLLKRCKDDDMMSFCWPLLV